MDYPDDYPDGEDTTGGLLTRSQREYVSDPGGYEEDNSAGSVRTMRARVRKRLEAALYDFRLLLANYTDDIDSLFREAGNDEIAGVTAMIGFVYRGTRHGLARGLPSHSFEGLLKRAIQNQEFSADDPLPNAAYVDVTFEDDHIRVQKPTRDDVDLEEIGEKFAAGEKDELSRVELLYFLGVFERHDVIDPQFPARMQQRLIDHLGEQEHESANNETVREILDEQADARKRANEREESALSAAEDVIEGDDSESDESDPDQ